MAKQPFHLGWFVMKGYGPKGWRNLWGGPNPHGWVKPDLLVHLAKELERAAFDYVMIEDSMFVPDAYRATSEYYLRSGWMTPKMDPMPYLPIISRETTSIGVVATITTSFYPPFLAARLATSLDLSPSPASSTRSTPSPAGLIRSPASASIPV